MSAISVQPSVKAVGLLLGAAILSVLHAELPTSGFVIYSKGDGPARTIHRRMVVNAALQPEEKVVNKGAEGGDIQNVISHDGKWLAFARSMGGTGSSYGGDDYHTFGRWDVYIARLDGALPATPIKVSHGYWPSWGDDSHNATKTLYFSHYEDKAIWKATIDANGNVSNVGLFFDVPTNEKDLHMQMSPDGRVVAYRNVRENWTIRNVWLLHIAGPFAGQEFDAQNGCHPSWTAGSRWLFHAGRVYIRNDGKYYHKDFLPNNMADYHFGSDVSMQWFICGTKHYPKVQNKGLEIAIMRMDIGETEITFNHQQRVVVTDDGSWCDVHTGTVGPAEVRIDDFWAEPPSIVPGGSAVLKWKVSAATAVKIDGATVTGDSKTVQPAQTTTYTLTAEGEGGPKTAQVTVTVSTPVLTSIDLTPKTATLNLGETLTLTAAPKDQSGNAIDADLAWSVDGVGSLSTASGNQTVFTAPAAQPGSARITVAQGSVAASADILVVDPSALRIKVNCGGPQIGEWASDGGYVVASNAGQPFTFTESSDLSSAQGAAPEEIYMTVRHWDHAYSFTDVPNGDYLVRIHFTDNRPEGRLMNYAIEGTSVLADFSPAQAAGGTYKAIVKEFDVTVSDGNGLQIAATKGSGTDVFEAGIEVLSAGEAASMTVTVSPEYAGQTYQVGQTVPIKWSAGSAIGEVIIQITVDDGENWLPITGTNSVGRGNDTWGNYPWTIPESILGTSTVSTNVILRVSSYSDGSKFGESGVFAIASNASAARKPRSPGARGCSVLPLDNGRIALDIGAPGIYEARIISPRGAVVGSRTSLGSGTMLWDTELAPGAYIVQVQAGALVWSTRCVLH